MSGYIGATPVPQATQHREAFTATAAQTSFATVGYTPQFVDVYLNGVKLASADYTATNGSDIVLTTGAAASDILEYVAYTPFEVADQTFTGTTTVDVLSVNGAFTSLGIDDNATSTAITIDASGFVGIGTAAPASDLHIENSAGSCGLRVISNATGTSYLNLGDPADNNDGAIEYNNASRYMAFQVANAERMRIDASGQMLLGQTSASLTKVGITAAATGNCVALTVPATSGYTGLSVNRTGSNGEVLSFQRAGVTVGNVSVTGAATAYSTSSDPRLKENITPIQGASDIVMALNPVTYTFKADGSWMDGFLTTEVQTLLPSAVVGEPDAMKDEDYEVSPAVLDDEGGVVTEAVTGTRSVPDYQGMDYSRLTPILTAALQEALNKIDALEAQNATFETRLAALEATP